MGYFFRVSIAFAIGIFIGAGSRWFKIPVPAPPKLIGALLILSITLGYTATDSVMTDGSNQSSVETIEQSSGSVDNKSLE